MGVPKFYRWISERYPCLSEVVKEYQVPEFDALYLDMNGIIHNCSHPNDEDPHFRITEEQIFKDIFHYIEVLFRIIRPKETFFMAVDGVAPRAKMNQQRGRRFRSAKEAEANIREAEAKGEVLPTEKRFDSNCITPGTKFMTKLQTQLEYFVKSKITTDPLWQGLNIYLSGHQTPGEGEHKIMEFIRHRRSQHGYNPNTRHCMYGLDADLMILALCSHEPHFSLLREEVQFTKRKKAAKTARAEETTFHLLHISLMREYIGHEFQELQENLPFPFDLESIIDDWVLLGFLVGNDFLPHLPDLHISTAALPFLYQSYRETLPSLDGYLNEGGTINLPRFQLFLKTLSEFDLNHFEEVYSDYKWLESKTKKRVTTEAKQGSKLGLKVKPCTEEESLKIVKELAIKQGTLSSNSTLNSEVEGHESGGCDSSESEADDTFMHEFRLHKRAYYEEKFKVKATPQQVGSIAFEYMLGLQWICHYYYNGVQSWSWYFPYHYSPYVSDLRGVANMRLKLRMSKPFLPFQQLMAVLPAASKDCIPSQLWGLMDEGTSPIGDFYPSKFSTDLNGKLHEWEAVVLIPFIDESRLLTAMQPCISQLTAVDRARNQHAPCQLFTHDPGNPHFVGSSLPGEFPDIELCVATRRNIPTGSWVEQNYNLYTKGLLQGCQLNVYFQGFPTLFHLQHKASLKKQGVKVFQAPSRNENMILKIVKKNEDKFSAYKSSTESTEEVAARLLNQVVFVNWPHMEEAKVFAVADQRSKFSLNHQTNKVLKKVLSNRDTEEFLGDAHDFETRNLNRRGINIGETKVLVYAQILTGRKYVHGGEGVTLVKQYASVSEPFALQAVLKDIEVCEVSCEELGTLEELFPVGAPVFHLGVPHYGHMGEVIEVDEGHVKVKLRTSNEPDLNSLKKGKNANQYFPGWRIASMVGISSYIVSRITGTIYVYYPTTRKWNIGLNLRFSRENCGIAGFTKKSNNEWFYSETLAAVLKEYLEKFSEVIKYLSAALKGNPETNLDAERMFGSFNVADKLLELSAWLKSQPCFKGQKVHESSDVLELEVVQEIDRKVQEFKSGVMASLEEVVEEVVKVSPVNLHRPLLQQGNLVADQHAQFHLVDRVANIREGFTVPLGLKGTIIGSHRNGNTGILCDVLFDDEFMGGLTIGGQCPPRRGYQLPSCSLINLSHGTRCYDDTINKPVAVVRPHHQQSSQQRQQSSQQRQQSSQQSSQQQGRLVEKQQRMQSPNQRASQQTNQQRSQRTQLSNQHHKQRSNAPQNSSKEFSASSNSAFRPTNNNNQNSSNFEGARSKVDTKTPTSYANNPPTPVAGDLPSGNPQLNFSQMWESFRRDEQSVSSGKNEGVGNSQKSFGNPVLSLLQAAQTLPKVSPSRNDDVIKKNEIEEASQITFDLTESLKSELKIASHPPAPPSADTTETCEKEQFQQLIASLKPQQPVNNHLPYMAPFMHPINQHQPIRDHSKQFSLQNFLVPNSSVLLRPENFAASPGNSQMTSQPPTMMSQPPTMMSQHPTMMSQSQENLKFNKEGTEKLCEILSVGNTGEKLIGNTEDKVDDHSSTSEGDDAAESSHLEGDFEDKLSLVGDVDAERSTSVEDKQTGHTSKVEELLEFCRSNQLFPPIYTYFDDVQGSGFRASLRLSNGNCFQSSCLDTKEKCMEQAASVALTFLNGGGTPMPPFNPHHQGESPFNPHHQGEPPFNPHHLGPPFVMGQGTVPYMAPSVSPLFYLNQDGDPIYPQIPPPILPYLPHFAHQGYNPRFYGHPHQNTMMQPVYHGNQSRNNHPPFATPSFIPSQVMRQQASNCAPPQTTPNLPQSPEFLTHKFVLSDSPTLGEPPAGTSPPVFPQPRNKRPTKPKPKLAISFKTSKNN